MNILDIDLDFFAYSRVTHRTDDERDRPNHLEPWKESEVRRILEERFSLNLGRKLPGIRCIHHDEVFAHCRSLISEGRMLAPFRLVHVDAHADLGLGDCSYEYILRDLIRFPLDERRNPNRGGLSGLGFGNFLAFAVANRWISRLDFIINRNWSDDIHPCLLTKKSLRYWRSLDIPIYGSHSLEIELLAIDDKGWEQFSGGTDIQDAGINNGEPVVPFDIISEEDIGNRYSGFEWDLIFLTQSPGYTSESADLLLDVIEEYMNMSTFKNESTRVM